MRRAAQALWQLAAVGATLSIALVGGTVAGLIVAKAIPAGQLLGEEELFEDAVFWYGAHTPVNQVICMYLHFTRNALVLLFDNTSCAVLSQSSFNRNAHSAPKKHSCPCWQSVCHEHLLCGFRKSRVLVSLHVMSKRRRGPALIPARAL